MDKKFTAWMIREDGVAIPCVQHIYGSLDCIEETLYAAEWHYKNTKKEETKNLVLRFISAYAVDLNPDRDLICNLLEKIKNQPYVTLTFDFIQAIGGELFKAGEDLQELNRCVCEGLNSEFLRARLGGMYLSEDGNRDMYFRVSSDKYSWNEIVKDFLLAHKKVIRTVTVLYDKESTGKSCLLADKNGFEINHLPVIGGKIIYNNLKK